MTVLRLLIPHLSFVRCILVTWMIPCSIRRGYVWTNGRPLWKTNEMYGTVTPARQFNPERDASLLYRNLRGFGKVMPFLTCFSERNLTTNCCKVIPYCTSACFSSLNMTLPGMGIRLSFRVGPEFQPGWTCQISLARKSIWSCQPYKSLGTSVRNVKPLRIK